MTYTEYEERVMEDVKMQALKTNPPPRSGSSSAIMFSNQINITHETRSSHHSEQPTQNSQEAR